MKTLKLPNTKNKDEVFKTIQAYLASLRLNVVATDFVRPWGGFFVIDTTCTDAFIAEFFPGYSYDEIAGGLNLTPKILVAEPDKRLSWQYHHRREEVWSVIAGRAGVVTSVTDEQGPVREVVPGEVVSFGSEVRHRLIGMHDFAVVAEFWKHTDPNSPSDESDIVRVEDDFKRA